MGATNDAPSFTASDPAPVNEDAVAQTLAGWVTSFTAGPANESTQTALEYVVSDISNAALFAVAPAVAADGTLTYALTPDALGTSTFKVAVRDSGGTANGGVDPSPAQTCTITVNAVNDAPGFTAANPPAVNEDTAAHTLAGWVTSFTAGPANESTQTVAEYLVSDISSAALFAV